MTQKSDRDAALTYLYYDRAGNVTNRVMPGGNLKWQAIYNNAGQVLQDWNVGAGNVGTRTNSRAYSSSGPFAGLLGSRTDNLGNTCAYSYDDWLRVTNTTHSGTYFYYPIETSWGYDRRGLWTNVVETDDWRITHSDGPISEVHRDYDAYGEVINESVFSGGVEVSLGSQSWDSAG